jgi:hypothetical protein
MVLQIQVLGSCQLKIKIIIYVVAGSKFDIEYSLIPQIGSEGRKLERINSTTCPYPSSY